MSGTQITRHTAAQYRAPAQNGQILAIPELGDAVVAAQENQEQLQRASVLIASLPLPELRQIARRDIISRAAIWTNSMTGQHLACAECSHHASLLYVTGHQPQLAHPGVWAKNFAASGLATRSAGLGLNIIVDNDTVGTQAIRLPQGTFAEPIVEQVHFDCAQPQQPWEELKIHDRNLFESFAHRVVDRMRCWNIEPLIQSMWPTAVAASHESDSMVQALSACRILQERRWGGANLELPLSELCQTESFLIFVKHILDHFEEFHADYNRIVVEYRHENRIRNNRHPVPNLQVDGTALELPFWFWREGDVERGQLFARRDQSAITLLCRGEVLCSAPSDSLLDALQELQHQGKLRTRALTTTLFSRLCLADLFIHGIGGAKYDEMTNSLMEDFFGIVPPRILVLSATLHLPVGQHEFSRNEVLQLKQKLRDHEFNADRYLSGTDVSKLRTRKQSLIEQHWKAQTADLSRTERARNRMGNRRRHIALKQVNLSLAELARDQVQKLKTELISAESKLNANSILNSREFSASLFPEGVIHELVAHLLNPARN